MVLSEEEILYREATALEADGQLGKAAIAFGKLGDYTDARERSFAIWEKITPRGSLVSNGCAIRSDGTVVHMNPARQEATAHWRDIVKTYGALGLKADGTVLITTFNGNVPELDVSGWRDIVDIAPGSCNYSIQTSPNSWYGHNSSYLLGLKADGTVIAIGDNNWGHCDVSGWTDIVAIATGSFTGKNTHTYPIEPRTLGDATYDTAQTEKIYYSVGIKADGTIVTAGKIPESWDLSEWMDIIKVSIYEDHMAGLRSDGTVVSTQYDVSDWKNITDIDAGPYHLLGLRSDGTVAAIGNVHMYGHLDVEDWTDIVAISATDRLTVGLKADGTVVDVGHYESEGDRNASSWSDIVAIATAPTAMIYGLKADGTVVSQHKNAVFTDVKMPTKTLPVRNSNGTKPEASSVLSGNVLSPDWQEIIVSKADYRPFESLTQIEYITFLDTQEDSPERTWDVSENHDGSVLAWVEPTNNNARFHLYIAAEGGVNAPEDSSMLFADERAVMRNLQTIHFGDAFHTGNVTNMSRMFDNCLARSLDVSDFDTSRVTDMSAMFRFCHNLTSLDLSNFDTSNVTDMDFMFWYFSSFTSLELGEFDTSSVTSYKNFMEEGMTVNGQPWKELFNH